MEKLQAVFAKNAHLPLLKAEDKAFTYQQVWEQSLLAANVIKENGISSGDNVGLLMPANENSFFYLIGLWMIGATPALISPKASEDEKNSFVKTADLKTILIPEKLTGKSDFFFESEDLNLILFTSGSTGDPKATLLSSQNLYYSAKGSIQFYEINESDKYLLSLPLNHIGGLMVFMRSIFSGAQCIISGDLESSILKYKPSLISLVPTQLIRLTQNKKVKSVLKTTKALLIGGDHLPEKYFEKSLPISLTYGLSESCAQVAASKPGKKEMEILPFREILIGKNGRIGIRGKTRFKYYLKNGEKEDLEQTFWSMDHGELKEDVLTVFGRLDDIFICGGENINPAEIEKAMLSQAGVEKALVVPVKDQEYGHIPFAFYQAKKDLTFDLNKYLPVYKMPRYFKRYETSDMKWAKNKLVKLAEKYIHETCS